jgi:hypothetical protein
MKTRNWLGDFFLGQGIDFDKKSKGTKAKQVVQYKTSGN